MHGGNTHQDSEATAFNANRKHQIVLNMEVKRIEMEKKMRERYFSFEMSLMRARRLKIIERQKSLGIYRPHTMENDKNLRKAGAQTTSVFFTQSVAMDSKVTLPPVLQRSRTTPALPSKPERKSFTDNKLIIGREQAKRIRQSERKEGFVDGDNGLPQHQRNEKPPKGGNRMTEAERKTDDVEDNLTRTNAFRHEHGIVKQSVDSKNLLDKDGIQLQATRKDNVEERKAQQSEQNISHRKCDSTVQNESKQTSVQETATSVVKPQNSLKKMSLSEQSDFSAARAQNISTFTNFEELRAWHDSMDPTYFADDFNKCLMRSKSAKGYRKNIEVGLKVRPQTALI